MSIVNGPNLGLMENANTGEVHDTALRALLRGLDALVMPNVKGYLTNTPPGSPANGDCYIIGAAPTGTWAGQGGKVARYSAVAVAWEFFTPKNGWMIQANSAREIYRYTASAWEVFYQEGTWTPAVAGSTTPGTNTYAGRSGAYRRIASQVFITCSIFMSSKDAAMAGTAQITGLPFMVQVDSGVSFGACINFTAANDISGQASGGTTAVDLFTGNASNWSYMTSANVLSSSAFRASAFYPI